MPKSFCLRFIWELNRDLQVNFNAPMLTVTIPCYIIRNRDLTNKEVVVAGDLVENFVRLAQNNTNRNVETCGILCGSPVSLPLNAYGSFSAYKVFFFF